MSRCRSLAACASTAALKHTGLGYDSLPTTVDCRAFPLGRAQQVTAHSGVSAASCHVLGAGAAKVLSATTLLYAHGRPATLQHPAPLASATLCPCRLQRAPVQRMLAGDLPPVAHVGMAAHPERARVCLLPALYAVHSAHGRRLPLRHRQLTALRRPSILFQGSTNVNHILEKTWQR